ncbi:MAG: hypothetical protein EZS28_001131 [Streblomastix strix]|uniref:RNase H type-1 domain-containing protein n=1 Tax=Streblomastix strix TaxID=222440 RepID=A0A5J4X950_9EUKA|nr:MAG: hypothetical protein EZS28_001131 [Streblomastix strix]
MEVKMPHATKRLLKNLLKRRIHVTLNQQIVIVKDLASLIGSLNYLRFQFLDASFYLNSLNHLKCQALKKGGLDCSVKLSKKILGNLFMWFKTIKENRPRSLLDLNSQKILTTDAAESGWGTILQWKQFELIDAGQQNKNWLLKSSNQRELAAVLMVLRAFRPLLQSQEFNSITLETDNQTVEYQLRRGRAKPPMIYLVRLISELLREMQVTLSTIHIPGLLNLKADSLS